MWDKVRKWKWKYIVPAVLAVLVVLAVVGGRRFFIAYDVDDYNDESGEWTELAATTMPMEQNIVLRKNVSDIHVLMSSTSGNSATLVAELVDEAGNVLSSAQAEIVNTGGAPAAIVLNISTEGIEEPITAVLRMHLAQETEGVSYCVQQGDYAETLMYQNQRVASRMRMSVNYGGTLNVAALLLFIMSALAIIAVFVLPKRFGKIENYFLMLAMTFGLLFAFVNPPVQECDGFTHLIRSMDVSYGNVLAPFKDITHESKEVILPENFFEAQWPVLDPSVQSANNYMERIQNMHFSEETQKIIYPGSIPAFAYYPQALGLKLGRMLDLNMYMCVVLSRIFNLLAYVAMTYFAIKLMPVFKNLMAVVALMPLTLYQAASNSQDAVLNALCFLFIGLCCYYAFGDKKELNWKHTLILGWILTGLLVIKYVYVCLGLLVFMIPKKRFKDKKAYWTAFAIALLPLLILGGYQVWHNAAGVSALQAKGVIAGGGVTQMDYLRMHPTHIVKVFAKTIFFISAWIMESLYIFGSLNCNLGVLPYIGPCFLVAVGMLDVKGTKTCAENAFSARNRILMFMGCIVTAGLTMLGIYIADGIANPVGAPLILGLQGRYFIPLLPLLFMALHSKKVTNGIEHFERKVSGIAGVMLLYSALMLQHAYY